MGKLSKDRRDVFYRKAKEEGFRARSAYKLLHLNDQFQFLSADVRRVVDLCAAPGGWSQVVSRMFQNNTDSNNTNDEVIPPQQQGGGMKREEEEEEPDEVEGLQQKESYPPRFSSSSAVASPPLVAPPIIVAVDLQVMAPLPGVHIVQGDITSTTTLKTILSHFDGQLADLVLCDGAPDLTGLHDMDEFIQSQLLLSALSITTALLKKGGVFVAKVFRGENIGLLYVQLLELFEDVYCCKPASSRNSSLEAFVVCKQFKRRDDNPINSIGDIQQLQLPIPHDSLPSAAVYGTSSSTGSPRGYGGTVVPFMFCGDLSGFDSDRTYELPSTHVFSSPVQPPISATYLSTQTTQTRSACLSDSKHS
eukprot:GHVS01105897.1.p1 GENE.GHVS01105897.1~~GHVS01105897.1.p1  ORF type:complete len:363 (+),score=89.82 GHVS01105897.1:254-1342(+)